MVVLAVAPGLKGGVSGVVAELYRARWSEVLTGLAGLTGLGSSDSGTEQLEQIRRDFAKKKSYSMLATASRLTVNGGGAGRGAWALG